MITQGAPEIEYFHFETPLWAGGPHAQTLLGHLTRKPIALAGVERHTVELPDGDQLAVDLYKGKSNTVVYLFHGLGGSIDEAYLSRVTRSFLDLGHSVVLANHRGCGRGVQLICRQIYHAGRAEDLSEVIRFGKVRFPGCHHVAIGFSLSGNAVLLLAAGQRAHVFPDAVISVNAPLDLKDAALALSRGLNRLYDAHFILRLRQDVARKKKRGWLDPGIQIPLTNTVYDADTILAKLPGGFGDRESYYQQCSSGQYLKDIAIPTLMITAQDDPFVSSEHYFKAQRSAYVKLLMTDKGGHMGYLQRRGVLGASHWLDTILAERLRTLLT